MNYAKMLFEKMTPEEREAFKQEHGEDVFAELERSATDASRAEPPENLSPVERALWGATTGGSEKREPGTITRSEFEAMSHAERAEFVRGGGVILSEQQEDDREELPDGKMYRDQWDALPYARRAEFLREGGQLV